MSTTRRGCITTFTWKSEVFSNPGDPQRTIAQSPGQAAGGDGLFVLATIVPLLPSLHPRVASEYDGPTPTRMLEPPGFLALNYGRGTPIATMVAHVVYGGVLGAFYRRKAPSSLGNAGFH